MGGQSRERQHTLPEDGVFDSYAVELAVRGSRRVPLTDAERRAAAELLLRDPNVLLGEFMDRLNLSSSAARKLLDELGWRVVKIGTASSVHIPVRKRTG